MSATGANPGLSLHTEDIVNPSDGIPYYPLIRYMGSKYKLLGWIEEETSHLTFQTVLDGFSGSGVVAYLFKTQGKTVYTNDFLHFPYILAKAAVENQNQEITNDDMDILLTSDPQAPNFIQQPRQALQSV